MLGDAHVQPMLPVRDLDEATDFYEQTLGLEPVDVEPDTAVTYRGGGDTTLCVYRSEFGGTNQGTAALWEVDDVDETVAQLRQRGVTFEHYDLPGLTRNGDVHEAGDLKIAWFKDPGGNILSLQNRPTRQG